MPALSSLTGDGGQLGTGVGVAGYERIRNVYLDSQYRTQNSALSAASTQAEELGQAQVAFDEPSSTGLASAISAFWSAWGSLADSPTSEAAKEGVVAAGQQLAGDLNELSERLTTIATQASEQYSARAGASGEVEDYAKQIAALNGQIRLAEEAGQQPNDMLDRRDLLLDKLSALANVTVTKEADGSDTVTFGDAAKPLVEGTTVNWPQALTSAAGGQLGALLSLSSPTGALASYENALNGVAATLAKTVNALHTSTPFFAGETAATLAVAVTSAQVQPSSTGVPGATKWRSRSPRCAGGPPNRHTRGSWSRWAATSRPRRPNRATCSPS